MLGMSKNTTKVVAVLTVLGAGYYLWSKQGGKSLWSNASGGFSGTPAKRSRVPICARVERDGSTTQYSAHGNRNPCPYGGRLV